MKKILLIATLLPCFVQANELVEYDTYNNDRFGFQVSYPGGKLTEELNPHIFIPTGEPANGDGQYFVKSTGDAVIHVYGHLDGILDPNVGDAIAEDHMKNSCHIKTLLNNNQDIDITYKNQTDNVATYSGFYGKDIIYVKAIRVIPTTNHDSIPQCIYLTIQYPIDQKSEFDVIVKNVANSFKPI